MLTQRAGDRVDPDCHGYRLPTEAEWEYAARAGTVTIFYENGAGENENLITCEARNAVLDALAVYCRGASGTAAAGSKRANAWGLYDMLGNVFEHVEDWLHASYQEAPADGSAWLVPESADRVDRGGPGIRMQYGPVRPPATTRPWPTVPTLSASARYGAWCVSPSPWSSGRGDDRSAEELSVGCPCSPASILLWATGKCTVGQRRSSLAMSCAGPCAGPPMGGVGGAAGGSSRAMTTGKASALSCRCPSKTVRTSRWPEWTR
ncbi:MAG: formylglycine-generating enzyme family protein [Deltaproteobacteria bacterium]|nr:formylglycine-generating enzyme family protein [Deltaproteobacteria bacterium]